MSDSQPPGVGPALSALIEQWREKARWNQLTPEAQPHMSDDLKAMALCWAEARLECARELETALSGSGGGMNAAPFTICSSCATDGPNPPHAAVICRQCAKEIRAEVGGLNAAPPDQENNMKKPDGWAVEVVMSHYHDGSRDNHLSHYQGSHDEASAERLYKQLDAVMRGLPASPVCAAEKKS